MLIVTNPFMVVAIRCEWSSIKHQLRNTSDILQWRMMSYNHIGYTRHKKTILWTTNHTWANRIRWTGKQLRICQATSSKLFSHQMNHHACVREQPQTASDRTSKSRWARDGKSYCWQTNHAATNTSIRFTNLNLIYKRELSDYVNWNQQWESQKQTTSDLGKANL